MEQAIHKHGLNDSPSPKKPPDSGTVGPSNLAKPPEVRIAATRATAEVLAAWVCKNRARKEDLLPLALNLRRALLG